MAIFDITFKLIVALEFCLYFEKSFTTGSGSLKEKEICVVNAEDPEHEALEEHRDGCKPSDNNYKTPPIPIVGLVLARGGSKGIPNKNLATIGGITLLGRALKAMFQFGEFSEVWVSTDSHLIALEARAFGAQVYWRSAESATDTASSLDGVQDFFKKHSDVAAIALIQCTSPFIEPKFLHTAWNMIQEGYDSVFSVTRDYKLRWKENAGNEIQPVNFSPTKRPRRQDWKGELVENGMFYFFRTHLLQEGLLQGGR